MNTMNNPSVPVQGAPMLFVNEPAAAPAQAEERRSSNVWKPYCNDEMRNYNAVIRQLPAGRNLSAYPSILVYKHYLRDRATGVKDTILCLKNIPGNQECPICRNIWDRYNEAKKQAGGNKDAPEVKAILAMTDKKEWYTNVYIRYDHVNPENNGTVKLWNHSQAQHDEFAKPLQQNPAPAAQPTNAQGQNGGFKPKKKSSTDQKFTPYCPMTGHDYNVNVTWDTSRQFNGRNGVSDYSECVFDDDPSYLAAKQVQNPDGSIALVPDNDAMLAILDQCHDLNALIADVPTPQEALARLQAFWDEVERRRVSGATGGNHGYTNSAPQQQQMGFGSGYAQQPFAPAAQAAPMPQNSIPAIPQNPNVTVANPNAFMGIPQQGAPNPAQPAPQPMAQPAAANPFTVPGAVATGMPKAPVNYAAPAAPAPAPAAPAAQMPPQYQQPAAMPQAQQLQVPVTPAAPMMAAPGVPIVESDDDDDLPF